MKQYGYALALVAALTGVSLHATAQTTQARAATSANPLPMPDKQFVQEATMSNSTEVDAAKMALDHSYNPDITDYAHRMIVEHDKMILQLKADTASGVTAPKDNSDTALLTKLGKLHGHDFDLAYLKDVGLNGHRRAIAAFETEAQQGQDKDLKTLAQNALPSIHEHYDAALKLAKKNGMAVE